jgi:crossover junction endodeoxyribonuclease RuvC
MRTAPVRNICGDRAPQRRVWRVLGVDPAAAGPTGYGVVETDGRACRMVHFGASRPARSAAGREFGARLREIHELICGLIAEYSPDAVAVESVFTALNMKTALLLAEVRGVVQLAAAEGNVPVWNYSPREVKACVAGYGHASKQQMQLMVRAMLDMREIPEPSDAADALAVALCHVHRSSARARVAAAMAPRAERVTRGPAVAPRRTHSSPER